MDAAISFIRYLKRTAGLLALWVLCLLSGVISQVWMLLAIVANSPRAWTLAVAFDQLMNAATGGDMDETISSRAARGDEAGLKRWSALCRLLDWVDPGHCQRALQSERDEAAAESAVLNQRRA